MSTIAWNGITVTWSHGGTIEWKWNNGDNSVTINLGSNVYGIAVGVDNHTAGSDPGYNISYWLFAKESEASALYNCLGIHNASTAYQYNNQDLITGGVRYPDIAGQFANYLSSVPTSVTPEGNRVKVVGVQGNFLTALPASLTGVGLITNTEYYTINTTAGANLEIIDLILAAPPPTPPDNDPYSPAGDNEPEGGGGDFDDTTEDIDFPSLPSVSVSDSGFVSILTPSLAQINNLGSYLWSSAFDLSQVKKLYANPIDVILGLSVLPIAIPHSTTKTIKIGGVSTGVTMNVADSQFVNVDFGTLTIKTGTGGTYLDYSPYTKASIFLPYIGWRDLSIDEIMNKTLHLKYVVDIVSGGCVAMLKCGGSVLYEWSGQCAIQIPVTSVDYSSTISSAISAVGHIGSAVTGVANSVGNMASGKVASGIAGMAGSALNAMSGLASDVMNAKPQFPRSGSLGGPAGVMGHQKAYIALTRPNLAKPKYQSSFMGYPSYITYHLRDLKDTGFNAFSDVKLSGLGLTKSEIDELDGILKGGVYL